MYVDVGISKLGFGEFTMGIFPDRFVFRMSKLGSLQNLWVSGIYLVAWFPSQISQCTRLPTVDIHHNQTS